MALIDDFKDRFPTFDTTLIDDNWQWLDETWHCFYGGVYGPSTCENQRILLLLAHLFTVMFINPKTGPSTLTSSRTVGSVSTTSVVITEGLTNQQAFLMSTSYGQQFLMMIQFRHGAFFV